MKPTIVYNDVMNKQLIIFDLDGTLIDSALDLAIAVNYMLETLNRDSFDEAIIRGWVGNGAQTLVKRALVGQREVNQDLDEVLLNNALKIFLDYYAKNLAVKTKMYAGVEFTLKELYNNGFRLAIVTNKPYNFVEPILNQLNILNLFEIFIGGDSLDTKKPDPAPLKYVATKLDVDIHNCIMVGDSKNDILAAHACDMHNIAVTYGYNYGEDIAIYKPTFKVDNFSDILEILKGK